MQEQHESVFRRWVEEVWGKGKENTIEELFDENGIVEYPNLKSISPIEGKRHYKKFVRCIRAMFDDIRITVEQIAVNDNKVFAVCQFSALRKMQESDGRIIHKPINTSGLCQVVIEDGKIVWMWNNINIFGNEDVLSRAYPE